MHKPVEPTPESLPNPVKRYFAATRPAFLSITAAGCMLGVASAAHDGISIDFLTAAIALLFALVAHAAANVLNDYFDDLNGTDAINTERIFPFTGGSRFIQNGVLSRQATGRFGYALLLSVIPAGLWLAAQCGAGLILIGVFGLLTGWAYSAPPLRLASRGLGELAVVAGWLLIVAGSDYVQRGEFDFSPVAAGLGFALLSANLLYLNQFPDARADAAAEKRTLVVRLGLEKARWGYVLIGGAAYGWMTLAMAAGWLPALAAISMLPLLFSTVAARQLWSQATSPHLLATAIRLTIFTTISHAVMLTLVLAILN